MTHADDSAFPQYLIANSIMAPRGLTKRELFAAMAMQGLVTWSADLPSVPKADVTAKHAVSYADALIKELAREVGDE